MVGRGPDGDPEPGPPEEERQRSEQYGGEPRTLTLVEVIDRPGTDEDQAVFDAGGRRVVLGRRDGEWIAAS